MVRSNCGAGARSSSDWSVAPGAPLEPHPSQRSLVGAFSRLLVNLTPPALLRDPDPLVRLARLITHFALELAVAGEASRVKRSGLERRPHGAPRLGLVRAVPESAG